jgi:hypothetical protein
LAVRTARRFLSDWAEVSGFAWLLQAFSTRRALDVRLRFAQLLNAKAFYWKLCRFCFAAPGNHAACFTASDWVRSPALPAMRAFGTRSIARGASTSCSYRPSSPRPLGEPSPPPFPPPLLPLPAVGDGAGGSGGSGASGGVGVAFGADRFCDLSREAIERHPRPGTRNLPDKA